LYPSFFGDLQSSLPSLTGKANKTIAASKLDSTTSAQDPKMEETKSSTQNKWVGERMKNGGSTTVAKNPAKSGDAELVSLWYDRLVPLVDSFKRLAEDLGKDLADLFQNTSMSQADMLSKLASNLLINVLDIVKGLIQALVSVIAKLVLVIKDFGNAKYVQINHSNRNEAHSKTNTCLTE
jgi:hypothetical protein